MTKEVKTTLGLVSDSRIEILSKSVLVLVTKSTICPLFSDCLEMMLTVAEKMLAYVYEMLKNV